MEKTNLQARYRSTMIIMLSLLGSVILLVLVAYVMSQSPQRPALDDPNLIKWLLWVVHGFALILGIGIIVGRRVLFRTSRLMRLVEEGGLNRLVDELASKTILLAAMSELIALLAVVLSLLIRSYEAMWRLTTVGVLLLLYNMPRRSAWQRTVQDFSRLAYEE